MVRFNARQSKSRHRSGHGWRGLSRRGWQTGLDSLMPTNFSSRISSSQVRPSGIEVIWRGQNRISRPSHDIRDARQVRLFNLLGSVSKIASRIAWKNSRASRQSGRAASPRWRRCFGKIVTYATTLEGQFYFALLKEFSMTPQEWRELDPRDSAFLANAFAESKRRENEHIKRRQMASRRR